MRAARGVGPLLIPILRVGKLRQTLGKTGPRRVRLLRPVPPECSLSSQLLPGSKGPDLSPPWSPAGHQCPHSLSVMSRSARGVWAARSQRSLGYGRTGPCALNDGRTHVSDFERKGSSLSGLEGT